MNVVVDKHLTGWKDLDEDKLMDSYDEILFVGEHQDLLEDMSDERIGAYCKKNNCDLITADRTSYTEFFEKGTETLLIKKYGLNADSGQKIYVLKILEGL